MHLICMLLATKMHVPPGHAMSYQTRSANANALQYFDAFGLYKLVAHQLSPINFDSFILNTKALFFSLLPFPIFIRQFL